MQLVIERRNSLVLLSCLLENAFPVRRKLGRGAGA